MIKKIGITGSSGFIGTHILNNIKLLKDEFEVVKFEREFFNDINKLDEFVVKCDVIIHLAALNRHDDDEEIYRVNIELTKILIDSLNRTKTSIHIIMSSSTHESSENLYGRSKKKGRELFCEWARITGNNFTGLLIPNVFGPFCKPHYNSVVATFSYQIANNEIPKIKVDSNLKLIYVNELVTEIIKIIRENIINELYLVEHTKTQKVSKILSILKDFYRIYQLEDSIPKLNNKFELDLFNTYRSYIKLKEYFPKKFINNSDERGSFIELIKLESGGQVSFSTTNPGYTRGNHFHTRKIERFAVIKGKALIQIRRIGTDKILDFYLDGETPSYIDMPIWYTHNIKNVGNEKLYTNFWINEVYNQDDTDTFFEVV